jgi:hypothetical protein
MLSTMQLENYRGFQQYRLTGLSRVNLLVGKNNCGKTSVLEAVHLLASGGDPGVLVTTASRRGEMMTVPDEAERYRRPERYVVVSHLFHRRKFGPNASFSVRTDDEDRSITVRAIDFEDFGESGEILEQVRDGKGEFQPTLVVQIEGASAARRFGPQAYPATEQGAISSDLLHRRRRIQQRYPGESVTVQFSAPGFLGPRSMNEMWDKAVIEGRESEIIEAMRILEPALADIFFLTGESSYRYPSNPEIFVASKGGPRRYPLGSHGEGMRHLLALSLSLIEAQNGVLLVDEIDTGLHYSIMGDVWRLVTEVAGRSNVQVFATTHSSDCVRGLAWLCENHADLRSEVSLQKIEPELEQAVVLDADKIMLAVDRGLEVR